MKKSLIILIGCIFIAAAMCLVVSWPRDPGQTTGPSGTVDPTTNPTGSSEPFGTVPDKNAAVRLYICQRDDRAALEALVLQYSQQTGVACQIITGDLTNLMAGEAVPTIFCVHSQEVAQQWEEHMLDLTGTSVLEALLAPDFVLQMDGRPVALAMDVECYGLIYNAALLAQAGYTRSDITDLESLQAIAGYITTDRKVLGFDAFCQLDPEDQILTRCLLGLSDDPDEIRGFFDLYLSNATGKGASLEQFVAGEVVFYVGGLWEYEQISGLGMNNLDILPLYTTTGGALQCVVDDYWAVNATAAAEEVEASLELIRWLISDGEDGVAPAESLDWLLPFADTEGAGTAFDRLLRKYLSAEKIAVAWEIAEGMTEKDISNLTVALSRYAEERTDDNWAAVALLMM